MDNRVECIVKYNGNIEALADSLNLAVDVLSENYAIMNLLAEEQFFLSMEPQIEYIEEQKLLSLPHNPVITSSDITAAEHDNCGLTGRGILIATLDSGIDYSHNDFRNIDGTTRIISIWDQNVDGTPPAGFAIGNEYNQEQINAALAGTASDNIPLKDYICHGTAVAGLAAGNGRDSDGNYMGVAPEASLLIVKPAHKTSPYFTSDTCLMRGIKYAINVATARNMPLVININYGTNQGSHNGSSLFEQYINDMAARWKTAIVVPSGNEGVSGKHFQGRISAGEYINVDFIVQKQVELLNITLLKSFVDDLQLQIIDSTGRISSTFHLKTSQVITLSAAQVTLSVIQPMPYNSDQSIALIFNDLSGNTLMATRWTIRIKGVSVTNGSINMWLPVTEICGRNTAFLNPEITTSLTIPSTVPNVISVGCYNSADNTCAEFSGRGFTISSVIKPDICAPAVNVVSTATGGAYGNFTGTNLAAPITAGVCALMMQWGIVDGYDLTMYGQRLKAFLTHGTVKHRTHIKYPNSTWGYGALSLKNVLDYAEAFSDAGSFAVSNDDNYALPSLNMVSDKITASQQSDWQGDMILLNRLTRNNFPEGENPAISESYLNFLIPYDFNSRRILIQYPDILVSSMLLGDYAIIHVPIEKDLEYTNTITVYSTVERSRIFGLLSNPSLDAAGITATRQQQNLALTGRGVLVGIVDTGIDYNLDTFKYENGLSKILRIWDQTIQSDNINDIPDGFIYGTEYTMEQINQALASDAPYDAVPSRDEIGHGTFLTSLMAGRRTAENQEGAAPDAEIIAVKLRPAKQVTLNYSALTDPEITAYESVDILNGIEYLINISSAENRPLVIYFGLGSNDGAHDGLTYIEQYLSLVATIPNVIVVSAIGNEGDRGHHAAGRLSGNEDMKEIEFNVSGHTTGFFMSMWAFTPDRLSISLISPLGEIVERRKFVTNERVSYSFILESSRINIDYEYPSAKNGSQSIFIRLITPQTGLWKLRVFGDMIIDGRFNIWMPISSLWNNSTYFLRPEVDVTATIPSTAPALITVGAYNAANGSIFVSSSRGPNRLDELCPDFVAPGVNVIGVVPGGSNSTMTGTSVAAAITAGACALMLQWAVVEENYPVINNYRMRTYLLIGLTQRPEIQYPDNLWGYGELNLFDSFDNL